MKTILALHSLMRTNRGKVKRKNKAESETHYQGVSHKPPRQSGPSGE